MGARRAQRTTVRRNAFTKTLATLAVAAVCVSVAHGTIHEFRRFGWLSSQRRDQLIHVAPGLRQLFFLFPHTFLGTGKTARFPFLRAVANARHCCHASFTALAADTLQGHVATVHGRVILLPRVAFQFRVFVRLAAGVVCFAGVFGRARDGRPTLVISQRQWKTNGQMFGQ